MIFLLFFTLIVLQRITELIFAKRNEYRIKKRGAIEFGRKHYPFIVMFHIAFFLSLFCEVRIFHKSLSALWQSVLVVLLFTQLLRLWTIISLGENWNTKILVLPNQGVIRKGPYRFIRHPNYVVVMLEIILIPLVFQAYITALLFSVCNTLVLYIRIREEERALIELTNYQQQFSHISRFTP